jgi:hypothetical protein
MCMDASLQMCHVLRRVCVCMSVGILMCCVLSRVLSSPAVTEGLPVSPIFLLLLPGVFCVGRCTTSVSLLSSQVSLMGV